MVFQIIYKIFHFSWSLSATSCLPFSVWSIPFQSVPNLRMPMMPANRTQQPPYLAYVCNMYGKEHFISMHTQQPHKPKEMPISFSKLLEGIVTTQTIRHPLFRSHLSICSPSFSSLLFSMRLTIENHFLHSCFCFAFVVLPRFPLPLYRYYKYLWKERYEIK